MSMCLSKFCINTTRTRETAIILEFVSSENEAFSGTYLRVHRLIAGLMIKNRKINQGMKLWIIQFFNLNVIDWCFCCWSSSSSSSSGSSSPSESSSSSGSSGSSGSSSGSSATKTTHQRSAVSTKSSGLSYQLRLDQFTNVGPETSWATYLRANA